MNDERPEIVDVADGEFIISKKGEYELLEEGLDLECHIESVKKITVENFDKTAMVDKAVVAFKIDEGEGEGQVYTKWITPSNNPKSTMFQLLNAVYGTEWPENIVLRDALPGRTLRITLVNKETDTGTRQNVASFLKRSKTQPEKVEVETIVDPLANLDSVFGGAEVV